MAVPDFQTIMLPLTRTIADGREYNLAQMMDLLANEFALSEEDLTERIPSGRQTRFYNRVCWSTTHLKKAAIIENTGRGVFRITARGQRLLGQNLDRIDLPVLSRFPEYIEFQNLRRNDPSMPDTSVVQAEINETPEELLFDSYQKIREVLKSEILDSVKACTPSFFERLVVQLLVAMGYGGTREDAGQAVGKSGDGGIDGIIKEDRLGLDLIYLQAKKWESTVGRPDLQAFAGALLGKQANKGVFITTSNFSSGAVDFVKSIASNIILIDGDELADLMIDFNVGVSVETTYELKRIDSDYFVEE